MDAKGYKSRAAAKTGVFAAGKGDERTTKRPGGRSGTSVPNFASGPSGGVSASSNALPRAFHLRKDIFSESSFRGAVGIRNVLAPGGETHHLLPEADHVPELPFSGTSGELRVQTLAHPASRFKGLSHRIAVEIRRSSASSVGSL